MGNNEETQDVVVDEVVVLRKFEGDELPENEIERITIRNGEVTAHEKIENGEVVGSVDEPIEQAKEVD